RKIIRMLRDAGAREVHMRISSPATISPCYYGIDTPTRSELIASSNSVEEIRLLRCLLQRRLSGPFRRRRPHPPAPSVRSAEPLSARIARGCARVFSRACLSPLARLDSALRERCVASFGGFRVPRPAPARCHRDHLRRRGG